MKRDLFHHEENYKRWKKETLNSKGELNPDYIEEGLTKENSKLYLQYFYDLEDGRNMPKNSKRGGRDLKTLNRLRSKILRIFILLQGEGIKDIRKSQESQVTKFFSKWIREGHSVDYSKRFKAFWHWWMTVNRKQGKLLGDITEDLQTADNKERNIAIILLGSKYQKSLKSDTQKIYIWLGKNYLTL